MPKRLYREIADPESGIRFRFAYETGVNGPLHVEARHGVTPEAAVETFLTGVTVWNPANKRFETRTESHTLYWAWHASAAVLVITCFRRGDLEWKES